MIEPGTTSGRAGLAAIVAEPSRAVAAFDYDGTLAPIVDDPTTAVPFPGVVDALARLAERVGLVAVVTGRPAEVAVRLAGLSGMLGLEGLVVVGHYGLERWEPDWGEVRSAEAPGGLEAARLELPGLLDSLDLGDAVIEDKGLSVAVHVRRMADPARAFAAMEAPLRELAARHGLAAEPGRLVVELRPPGMDKGLALRSLVEEFGAGSVMFTGDDLGDVAAFAEVERLRGEGVAGLLVCSGSAEVAALAERADVVVDGPAGVAAFVAALADRLGDAPSFRRG